MTLSLSEELLQPVIDAMQKAIAEAYIRGHEKGLTDGTGSH